MKENTESIRTLRKSASGIVIGWLLFCVPFAATGRTSGRGVRLQYLFRKQCNRGDGPDVLHADDADRYRRRPCRCGAGAGGRYRSVRRDCEAMAGSAGKHGVPLLPRPVPRRRAGAGGFSAGISRAAAMAAGGGVLDLAVRAVVESLSYGAAAQSGARGGVGPGGRTARLAARRRRTGR